MLGDFLIMEDIVNQLSLAFNYSFYHISFVPNRMECHGFRS